MRKRWGSYECRRQALPSLLHARRTAFHWPLQSRAGTPALQRVPSFLHEAGAIRGGSSCPARRACPERDCGRCTGTGVRGLKGTAGFLAPRLRPLGPLRTLCRRGVPACGPAALELPPLLSPATRKTQDARSACPRARGTRRFAPVAFGPRAGPRSGLYFGHTLPKQHAPRLLGV